MNKSHILALGFFDGVHIGHAALLRECVDLAKQNHCRAGVVTFENHPDGLVTGTTPGLINTLSDRERLLRQFGMETVIVLPFDRKMKTMPWQDFFTMLREKYNAAGFVCGEDFRFGNRGEGNAEKLRQICCESGIPCAVIPQQKLDGVTASSTHIRYLMETGHMSQAVRFLGHPHVLTGKAVRSPRLGGHHDIPTANLMLPKELVVPKFGIYACAAWVDGTRYPAVTAIGTRLTSAGIGITAECWIPDYSGKLHNREVTLKFYHYLHPEHKFASSEAMRQEICRSVDEIRENLKTQS